MTFLARLPLGLVLLAQASARSQVSPALDRDLQQRLAGGASRRLQGTGSNTCLEAGDATACPLSTMPLTVDTLVYPGGDTRCIFSGDHSSDYAFQVIPGDSDKVLLYFEGGGGCFNQATSGDLDDPDAVQCTTSPQPEDPSRGIFSSEDERNPYKDYTKVIALYCSGDSHIGDATAPYTYFDAPVVHAGYQNTKSVVDWLVEQQSSGAFASELEMLAVGGESVGAIGAGFWAPSVIERMAAKNAHVFTDSFIGIFPSEIEASLISRFNPCEIFEEGKTKNKCFAGTLVIADVYTWLLESLGDDVPLFLISPKSDAVQLDFYNLLVRTEMGDSSALLDAEEFFAMAVEFLAQFAGENLAMFWVDNGDNLVHSVTDEDMFYTTSTEGADELDTNDLRMLFRWILELILSGEICTICSGGFIDNFLETTPTSFCPAILRELCAFFGKDVCESGILSSCGNVCCAESCGTCGGCDCAIRDGGADLCCPSSILFNGVACIEAEDVGCVVDGHLFCGIGGSGCDA